VEIAKRVRVAVPQEKFEHPLEFQRVIRESTRHIGKRSSIFANGTNSEQCALVAEGRFQNLSAG
jgi:hypothetical protein